MRILGLLLSFSCFAGTRVDSFVTPFDTGYQSEKLTRVFISNTLSYSFKTLYSVELSGVKSGDILDVSAVGELTNDLRLPVMLGSRIDLSSSPDADDYLDTILTGRSYNITHDMHHGVLPPLINSAYVFKADYATVYVNIVVWAAAYAAKSGDYLTVNQGYGRLTGKVLRLGQ
jgi:hypothetical protein